MEDGSTRVDHVVVLMLENHSVDHVLGFLKHPARGYDGLQPRSVFNVDHVGSQVFATQDGTPQGLDPDHSHEGALVQLAGYGGVSSNGGFVRSYEHRAGVDQGGRVMQCLDPAVHCRVLGTLAREFAVCTAWFSSVPGETWPNRNFTHAATSDSTVNIEAGFYYDPTIFELIAKAGATWRVYYDGSPQLWCYPRLWKPRVILDFLFRRRPRIGNWYEFTQFLEHVEAGDLASYSFIEPAHNRFYSDEERPRQTNSQHPNNNMENNDDFVAGERLIRDVYEALRTRPELFAKTLLLIVYDEHGGLYDHVRPPSTCPPGDPIWRGWTRIVGRFLRALADRRAVRPRRKSYDFSRLGVRVPAVLVSPWIPQHTIENKTFDHSSIPATLRAVFAPRLPNLTNRDKHANTFHQVVTTSPLPAPRPSPGTPNPLDLPPVPDLSLETPVMLLRDEREVGPPVKAQPGELDEQLPELEKRVRRQLRRPLVRAGRRARQAQGGNPVDLFTATARSARRD